MKEIIVPRPLATGDDKITITGDLKGVAENMSDVELRALVIQQYRMLADLTARLDRMTNTMAKFDQLMDMLSMMNPADMLSGILRP